MSPFIQKPWDHITRPVQGKYYLFSDHTWYGDTTGSRFGDIASHIEVCIFPAASMSFDEMFPTKAVTPTNVFGTFNYCLYCTPTLTSNTYRTSIFGSWSDARHTLLKTTGGTLENVRAEAFHPTFAAGSATGCPASPGKFKYAGFLSSGYYEITGSGGSSTSVMTMNSNMFLNGGGHGHLSRYSATSPTSAAFGVFKGFGGFNYRTDTSTAWAGTGDQSQYPLIRNQAAYNASHGSAVLIRCHLTLEVIDLNTTASSVFLDADYTVTRVSTDLLPFTHGDVITLKTYT